jgi:Co/Zn/Cd efflux system component
VIVTQDAAHTHGRGGAGRVLLLATLVTIGYAVVEAAAGWWSGSLALLGDAGHMFTGWMRADPVLTFVISGLIGFSSLRLAREALHGLMEGVPLYLSLPEIGGAMVSVEGVASVHDLHIWSLSAERVALSAHVVLDRMRQWEVVLARLKALLCERFGIEHVTLQPEPVEHVLQPMVRSGASSESIGQTARSERH